MDFYENFDYSKMPMTPREHVQMRPGMYIGGTDSRGLHHLVYEILDHMVEEVFIGRCQHIWLELRPDYAVFIRDDSEGLPVDKYGDTAFSQMEILMQSVGSGKSKFDDEAYRVTGGLHGLGLAAINALTSEMLVENNRDGYMWRQEYKQGKPVSLLTKVRELTTEEKTGTSFTFKPDFTILETNLFDRDKLMERCQELAYQNPNLTIIFRDMRFDEDLEKAFYAAEGLKTMVEDMNKNNTPLHEAVHIRDEAVIPRPDNPNFTVGIEIAFQFSDGTHSTVQGYVNTVKTPEGGTHVAALKATLLSALNERLSDEFTFDKTGMLTWDEIKIGLSAIITIRHPDPQFQSPTKIKLGNTEIYGPVAGLVWSAFSSHFSWDHQDILERIVTHYLSKRAK